MARAKPSVRNTASASYSIPPLLAAGGRPQRKMWGKDTLIMRLSRRFVLQISAPIASSVDSRRCLLKPRLGLTNRGLARLFCRRRSATSCLTVGPRRKGFPTVVQPSCGYLFRFKHLIDGHRFRYVFPISRYPFTNNRVPRVGVDHVTRVRSVSRVELSYCQLRHEYSLLSGSMTRE